MKNNLFFILISVIVVSFISFIGAFSLLIKPNLLKRILIYLVAFSAGAMFGDVFFHLLPEIVEENGFGLITSFSLLSGITLSFVLEKIICWRHCHLPITKNHIHNFAYMNLWGDFFHNFLDGLTIAAAYLLNFSAGIATTLAVVFHEIPQEIGDFGVLVHGGFKTNKALFLNFLTALSAVLGALFGLIINQQIKNLNLLLIPLAAGNFIYIAGSDLIPELHKEIKIKEGLKQVFIFLLGLLAMYLLLKLEIK